jgi:hypothetical protein
VPKGENRIDAIDEIDHLVEEGALEVLAMLHEAVGAASACERVFEGIEATVEESLPTPPLRVSRPFSP